MAKSLLLAGASTEMRRLAEDLGWRVVAVADPGVGDDEPAAAIPQWRGLRLHRDDAQAIAEGGFDAVALAIDRPTHRMAAFAVYCKAGVPLAPLIGGETAPDLVAGAGLTVQVAARVSVGCRLGNAVRLNVGALVMHDCRLADGATVAPRAVVLGRATLGARAYVGANATVLTDLSVGADAVIGAGAVVTRDVPAGAVVAGNPARPLERPGAA